MKIYNNLQNSWFEYQTAHNTQLHSLVCKGGGHVKGKEEAEAESSCFPTKFQENYWKTNANFIRIARKGQVNIFILFVTSCLPVPTLFLLWMCTFWVTSDLSLWLRQEGLTTLCYHKAFICIVSNRWYLHKLFSHSEGYWPYFAWMSFLRLFAFIEKISA